MRNRIPWATVVVAVLIAIASSVSAQVGEPEEAVPEVPTEVSFLEFYADRLGVPIAEEVADTSQDMLRSYMELFGVDLDEAAKQAQLDMLGGDMRLLAHQQKFEVFSGSWIERDPHVIVFAFTNDADRHLQELVDLVGFPDPARLKSMTFDWSHPQLQEEQLKILSAGVPGFETHIDEKTNQVVVYGPEPEKYEQELLAVADPERVRYEARPLSMAGCDPENCDPASMLEPVTTFVVESPLPSALSKMVWVPVALIVAGLLWVGWKKRRKTTD